MNWRAKAYRHTNQFVFLGLVVPGSPTGSFFALVVCVGFRATMRVMLMVMAIGCNRDADGNGGI